MASEHHIESLEYIADSDSRVLILGTMPGIESLKTGQYYAHPNNIFWDILFRVCIPHWQCDSVVDVEYEEKRTLALNNGIAIWDVLKYCDREGNLDRAIRNHAHNDFKAFFEKHPKIDSIFFNGLQARDYFEDFKNEKEIFEGRRLVVLPSTSPSNAMNAFRKLKEWKQIRSFIRPLDQL